MTRTMLLRELLPDVPGIPADLAIGGLVLDSRDVRAGDAFVAIAGFGTHGLGFVAQAKAAGAEVDVPARVLEFLAHKITSNVRELEGALNRLIAHANLFGRPVTLESAQEVLHKQGVMLETGERLRLLPHLHDTDGFFAAVLERVADA